MTLPGSREDLAGEMSLALEKQGNAFGELRVRQLDTQWKHKISVVPESSGITTRWWDYTDGVVRDGPSAKVSAGESITTTESGEYNVGDPALAGAGIRYGNADPVDGDGDDWWTGYTNRLSGNVVNSDGGGIGVKYFSEGEGDEGGAKTTGPQPYVWFDSGVAGVSDKIVPADRWNGEKLTVADLRNGGFIRYPHTYYDEGFFRINFGKKHDTGFTAVTCHTFVVHDAPMWAKSDLKVQTKAVGSNTVGYIDAAHYKAGEADMTIRGNGHGRDGTVAGSAVSLSQGTPVPLISIRLRPGWENVNVEPLGFVADCDASYYVFVSTGSALSNASWGKPNGGIMNIDPADAEYGVEADNDADGFASGQVGEIEYSRYVPSGGRFETSSSQGDIGTLGLGEGQIATLGIIPVDAATYNGGSFRWGTNF